MPRLRVYLLGTPRIEYEGEALKVTNRKALALLAYLILNPGLHSREHLATLLWPDSEPPRDGWRDGSHPGAGHSRPCVR